MLAKHIYVADYVKITNIILNKCKPVFLLPHQHNRKKTQPLLEKSSICNVEPSQK